MLAVDVRAVWISEGLCVLVYVLPGGDRTLSLTRCCSVKVKPYRMSGMMTRTERFHLIPPFLLFPSNLSPPLLPCHLRPAHSRDETDIYRPSPGVCIKTLLGTVLDCMREQWAVPLVRANLKCLRPLSLRLHGRPGLYKTLSNIIASVLTTRLPLSFRDA